MITPEEEAEIRAKYIPWKSTDPLWLDIARFMERDYVEYMSGGQKPIGEGRKIQMANLCQWLPSELLAKIGTEWARSPSDHREYIGRLCGELAKLAPGSRTTERARAALKRDDGAREAADALLKECRFDDPVAGRARLSHEVLGNFSKRRR